MQIVTQIDSLAAELLWFSFSKYHLSVVPPLLVHYMILRVNGRGMGGIELRSGKIYPSFSKSLTRTNVVTFSLTASTIERSVALMDGDCEPIGIAIKTKFDII